MLVLNKVAIVGVGLIGGSVGMAIRKRGLANQVVGIGRDRETLRVAKECGAIDEGTTILTQGTDQAEFVVICTPVESVARLVSQATVNLSTDGCITDVGSTKKSVVSDVDSSAPFVGSHPLAGSEKSGPLAADPDLFKGKRVIVTPTVESRSSVVERVHEFWRELEAETTEMTPSDHDDLMAVVSHVPHVIASLLAESTGSDQLPFAASGWADTTRIASGDAEMWTGILLDNRDSVLPALDHFGSRFQQFRDALETADRAAILQQLQQGKNHRDALGS